MDGLFRVGAVEHLRREVEWLFMDASYVGSHQHSSGAQGGADQAISQSAGGNSSKIHLIVDAHNYPVEFMISNGTTSDVKIEIKNI